MVDWFVLLVPLAALPIVLLFVFIGCSLDRSGIPLPVVGIVMGAGLSTGVDNVKVEFQYSLLSKESPSDLNLKLTLQGAQLAEDTFIDRSSELNLTSEPEGHLECKCVITKQSLEQVTVSAQQFYSGDPELQELVAFLLFQKGESFELTVLEIVFEGGGF
jgi:hypothetical protein